MSIIEDVVELADVSNFLAEIDADSTHGQCHQALTWLAIQIKKSEDIPDYCIWLCTGTFANYDHSWIQIEDADFGDGSYTIVDMTVDQFGEFDVPYVGPRSPGYVIRDAILLCDEENMQNFIEGLG